MPVYADIVDVSRPRDGRIMDFEGRDWSIEHQRAYHMCMNWNYMPDYSDEASLLRNRTALHNWLLRPENSRATWTRGFSVTQVDTENGPPWRIITNAYMGDGEPETPRARPSRAPAQGDPSGRLRDEPGWNMHRLPTGYATREVCRCEECVRAYVAHANVTWSGHGYAVARYVAPPPDSYAWTRTANEYWGIADRPFGHPFPPSRFSHLPGEQALPGALLGLINHPLRYILRRSGRIWSAEVEINGIPHGRAAELLGVQRVRYSERPEQMAIVASSDATVDAEIKISCIRDGARHHARAALRAYNLLKDNGAVCNSNAGHHVHVDGTRLADMGCDIVDEVITAAWVTGFALKNVLTPLSASGYEQHRGASLFPSHHRLENRPFLRGRAAIHSERMWVAASSGTDRVATMEYRLPNGTTEPLRAQSHISQAVALLDFAERAIIEGDEKAGERFRQALDRVAHGATYSEQDAAEFMLDAFNFSRDSKKALAVAAYTSPMRHEATKGIFERAAALPASLDTLWSGEAHDMREPAVARGNSTIAVPDDDHRIEMAAAWSRAGVSIGGQPALDDEDGSEFDDEGEE